jgi:hypothetical protein
MRTRAARPLRGLAAAAARASAGDSQVHRERGVLTIRLVRCYLRAWASEPRSLGRDVLKRTPASGSPRPPEARRERVPAV